MRFAIFGDIHANLEALQALLKDAGKHEVTHYVCLGDLVGYNANPRECVEIVRNLDCPVVKGNHDEQASMSHELKGFNPLAEEVIHWTRKQLTGEDKQWLRDLTMVQQVSDFAIVHATLDEPRKWGYVFNHLDAAASFHHQHTQICFFGHTHAPRAYIRDRPVKARPLETLTVEPDRQYFINCGSVGQPRDGDWRAAYVLYTPGDRLIELRRLEYDVWTAQAKIVAAGLPGRLRPPDSPG